MFAKVKPLLQTVGTILLVLIIVVPFYRKFQGKLPAFLRIA
jgi:hypothetical protein